MKIKLKIMKNQNTFKKGIEPKKQAQKLNPPVFEYAPICMRNKNIAWGFSLEKMEFKTFFR